MLGCSRPELLVIDWIPAGLIWVRLRTATRLELTTWLIAADCQYARDQLTMGACKHMHAYINVLEEFLWVHTNTWITGITGITSEYRKNTVYNICKT